jgi:2-phospho-L-lactate guanylyltransferase (CobY/MobA/RfbA family)
MATIVIPFRADDPKRRLGGAGEELALAMLADVQAACAEVAPTVFATAPGGQGQAVLEALQALDGVVAVVNADLPCATSADIEALLAAAPALVAAADGTTNALALADAGDFRPLYGSGSAARFGLRRLSLPNLEHDVDALDDLERLVDRLGPHTRAAFEAALEAAAGAR